MEIVRPVTHTGITADLRRIARRHTVATEVPPFTPDTRLAVPFSYAGALALSTSPPWVPLVNCDIYEVRALLGTAGSSTTVVTVYVNGTSVGTVSLASGTTNTDNTVTASLVTNTDKVTVGVTTVGTGASNLTVLVRVQ